MSYDRGMYLEKCADGSFEVGDENLSSGSRDVMLATLSIEEALAFVERKRRAQPLYEDFRLSGFLAQGEVVALEGQDEARLSEPWLDEPDEDYFDA